MKKITLIIAALLIVGTRAYGQVSEYSIIEWYKEMHYASLAITPAQEEANGKLAYQLITKEVFQEAEINYLKQLLPLTESHNITKHGPAIYNIRQAIMSRHPAFNALQGKESPSLWRRIAITITYKG